MNECILWDMGTFCEIRAPSSKPSAPHRSIQPTNPTPFRNCRSLSHAKCLLSRVCKKNSFRTNSSTHPLLLLIYTIIWRICAGIDFCKTKLWMLFNEMRAVNASCGGARRARRADRSPEPWTPDPQHHTQTLKSYNPLKKVSSLLRWRGSPRKQKMLKGHLPRVVYH